MSGSKIIIVDPSNYEEVLREIIKQRRGVDTRRGGDRHRSPSRDRHKNRASHTRPFVAIDGEGGGEDEYGRQHYLCLCASDREGDDVRTLFNDNRPLAADECFEFILGFPRDAYIVGYFFNYDATQMLRHLDESRLNRILHGSGALSSADSPERASGVKQWTHWKDYAIKYLPGHYLKIARAKRTVSASGFETVVTIKDTIRTVFECGGAFQQKFVDATETWRVGTAQEKEIVKKFKLLRPDFVKLESDHIRYCQAECRMLADMMSKFRSAAFTGEEELSKAGIHSASGSKIKIWTGKGFGAGYFAARMHETAGTPRRKPARPRKGHCNYLPDRPVELEDMAKRAYFGGRFEISTVGLINKTVYEYDIRSAYPAAMPKLPCPLHTKWEKIAPCDYTGIAERPIGELYVAEVIFEHPETNIWNALPLRTREHRLCWPAKGHGWYWSLELETAEKRFGAKIECLKAWKAVKCCDCQPYEWVPAVYDFRKKLDKESPGLGKPIKLALNSLYGKLAQHSGRAPFRDPVAAGLITAMTRVKLLEAVAIDPGSVVMLATDALYSTRKLFLDTSEKLGNWEHTEHESMFIVQPGLYWFPKALDKDGMIKSLKTRGIPKSIVQKYASEFTEVWTRYLDDLKIYHKHLEYNNLMRRLHPDMKLDIPELPNYPSVTVATPTFVGLKLALARREKLQTAGRWLKECQGGDCDHKFCGRRDISFDWHPKRDLCKVVETHVHTLPIAGSTGWISVSYDPEKDADKLTGAVSTHLLQEALPDKLEILHNRSWGADDFEAMISSLSERAEECAMTDDDNVTAEDLE